MRHFAVAAVAASAPAVLPGLGLAAGVLLLLPPLLLASAEVRAQKQTFSSGIYTCTTSDGRRLTSDRPISECSAREQRVLNADGSLRSVLPPFQSPEERALQEARDRRLAAEQSARNDAIRRDRNLMQRYPNIGAHQAARALALDDVNKGIEISERRIKELEQERKPLLDETEFYKGKPLPGKLKQQLDRNDAAAAAQQQLIGNSRDELVRINKRYDEELSRLKRLWGGAAPGSLGLMNAADVSASGAAGSR